MNKTICYLLLLIVTSNISSLALKTRSKVVSTLEEYGSKDQGSSISLKKMPKDENYSMTLLSEYQDYMGNGNFDTFTTDENINSGYTTTNDSDKIDSTSIKKIPLRNYKNTQVISN